jgi:hypothetical protein
MLLQHVHCCCYLLIRLLSLDLQVNNLQKRLTEVGQMPLPLVAGFPLYEQVV